MKKTLLFLTLLGCVSSSYAMEHKEKTDEAAYTVLLKRLLAQPVNRSLKMHSSQRITVRHGSEEWEQAQALAQLSRLNKEKPQWVPIVLYNFYNEQPSLEIHYYTNGLSGTPNVPNAVQTPNQVDAEATIRRYMGEKTE